MDAVSGVADADFARHWESTCRWLDERFKPALPRFFPECTPRQRDVIAGVLGGGKRLRAGLLCLVADALSGRQAATVLPALAVECVHAATLIHDDFVDNDTERRGLPATWTTYGARRAVLVGDVILATAIEQMATLAPQAGAILARAIARTASGAFLENQDDAGAEVYERVVRLKTGELFGAAAELGALAADAAPGQRTAAFQFGLNLGEAYQLADDIQDLLLTPHQRATEHRRLLLPLLAAFGRPCPRAIAQSPCRFPTWLDEVRAEVAMRMGRAVRTRQEHALSALAGLDTDGMGVLRLQALAKHVADPAVFNSAL